MTPSELFAIRARLDAATPGPWEHTQDRDVVSTKVTAPMFDYRNEDGSLVFDDMTDYRVASLYYGHEGSHPWRDAELIAHAPTDLRALLDEVERLIKREDELVKAGLDLMVANKGLTAERDRLRVDVHFAGVRANNAERREQARIRERDTAFRRGAEEMREVAVRECWAVSDEMADIPDMMSEQGAAQNCATRIRALPIPEDK